MAYARNEPSRQCGHDAVVVEVALAPFHLFLVQQTHLAPLAVGKAVDDGTPYVVGHQVVDRGAQVGTDGGKEYDEPHVQLSAGGMVGCRCDDEFRGYGYYGALQQHEEEYGAVVQVA